MLLTVTIAALSLSVGCGGSGKPAKSQDDSDDQSSEGSSSLDDELESASDIKSSDDSERSSDEEQPKKTDSSNPKNNPDVQFKEGGTVEEAINAVPQGLPRENIDQEDLNKPLLDPTLYKECKVSGAQHFELRYAVWDGRIVGTDIKTTPKNAKVEECVKAVIQRVKWREKTKSLNISTVSF